MAGPLAGLRVVDLTEGDGAPFCAMQLGDAGADVVKVERLSGDWARRLGPPFDHEDGSLFMGMNRNKRSVAVDLDRPDGLAVVQDLVRGADVLVHSFPRAGDAARLGLDYDTLAAVNPGLVYSDISVLEREGPEADRPATDFTLQARAGIHRYVGQRGEEPVRFGSNYVGVTASLYAMQAIVAALFWRRKTGQGQKVETSYLRAIIATQQNYLTSFSDPDDTSGGGFYTSHMEPPSHGLATKTRSIEMGLQYATDPDAAEHLLEWLGVLDEVREAEPSLADRPIGGRGDQALIWPYLRRAFLERPYEEIAEKLDELGMMFAPIHDYGSLYADPGVLEAGVLSSAEHPVRGTVPQVSPPWVLDETPAEVRLAPPLLGEHTDEVLAELAYDAARIGVLRDEGVIRSSDTGR
ncbi:MAG: CoA transferase [Dehalococcoidia bacterium]